MSDGGKSTQGPAVTRDPPMFGWTNHGVSRDSRMCEECERENLDPYQRSVAHFETHREVLKLQLLFEILPFKDPMVHREYVLEKVSRLLDGVPITLDGGNQGKYNRLMTEPMTVHCPHCRRSLTSTGIENFRHMENCKDTRIEC